MVKNILRMQYNRSTRCEFCTTQVNQSKLMANFSTWKIKLIILQTLFALHCFAQPQYLDSLFGNNGISLTDFGHVEGAWSIINTSENKIVASGWSKYAESYPEDILLMRFNNNGSIDTTFRSGYTITIGNSTWESAYSSIIQKDGKILVGGRFYNGLDWDFILARFYEDGNLDSTFANNGFAIVNVSSDDRAFSIDLQNDGKIVVAGFVKITNWDLAVLRFQSSGLIDSTFGNNGIVIKDIDGDVDVAFSVKVQSNGKIIACGWTFSNASWNFLLIRFNSDGSLDQNFGANGIVITDIDNVYNTSHSIVIQADGKYVVAGYRFYQDRTDTDILLARYNIDGSIDQSFGLNGIVTTDINENEDFAWDLLIQHDTKIVVTGYSKSSSSKSIVTLRYRNNGQIDSTFGDNGIIITSIFGIDEEGRHLVQQSDGKILVTGYSFNGIDTDLFIIRIKPDLNVPPILVQDSSRSKLFQNYPNPFEKNTSLQFYLNETDHVSLKIYNVLGQEVSLLVNEDKAAGIYKVIFDGSRLPNGIYLYQLMTKKFKAVNKMILLR